MSRKSTMRDNVNAVRSQLLHISNLPREQIELALLYYESNIDATVEAFKRDGANEALGGWTQTANVRGNASSRRTNNRTNNTKPLTLTKNSSVKNPPSNRMLRPSERVSNIFQIFAEGGTPSLATNGSVTTSNAIMDSPTSISSSSFMEQVENHSNLDLPNNDTTVHDETMEQKPSPKSQSRKNSQNHHESTSSTAHNPQLTTHIDDHQTTTMHISNNKKLLAKSVKDLQRQASTLTNVEVLFDNELKSSLKRIDDVFKQLYEIIKQREVELYLELDKVKEQGLSTIHNRQKRATELRQRIDRCDRLEPAEIDNLRHDIKQFVTDRRYELGEELSTSHRFEFDQKLLESLKTFGHILPIGRTRATSSVCIDNNASTIENSTSEKVPTTTNRISSVSSSINDTEVFQKQEQPLPQRTNKNQQIHSEVKTNPQADHLTNDNHQNCDSSQQANGSFQYYDETNNYQNGSRRRVQEYTQGNAQRPRSTLNYFNDNSRRNRPKQTNNTKPNNTYNRPRPPPKSSQPIVPVQN